MADLNQLIAQLEAADEISEALAGSDPTLTGELRAAIRDATVCAFRLRLARDLAGGAMTVMDEG